MPDSNRKRRVPTLKFTKNRNTGWHVSYRDPTSGSPRKHRFGMVSRKEAEQAYHVWVAAHLQGRTPTPNSKRPRRRIDALLEQPIASSKGVEKQIRPGSLLHAASSLLRFEESRVRSGRGPRRQGTISEPVYEQRKRMAQEFLQFLNSRYGVGAVGQMELADLTMTDVEAYNQAVVLAGYSSSQVTKRLQLVKAIIDRAGRPENGGQVLSWNWDARDVVHGKPAKERILPTLKQLKLMLRECGTRETAMVWIAIGCGFGQKDLAVVRVGQIDKKGYDLRRGKTGVDRYGDTPAMVWKAMQDYLKDMPRKKDELLFVTSKGMPLVHGNSDSVYQWWSKLAKRIGKECKNLGGFYVLRHLGATEFGSRRGCAIGDMKRWLGHSASSQMADVYMKPVSPENRPVVEWVREVLRSGKADLRLKKAK